jgi:5-methylcytosine-specific restriction endonuclease McrA
MIRRLYDRQRGRCPECGPRLVLPEVHVDHRVAIANGGRHEEDNLQLTHPLYNLRKAAR